MRIILKNFDTNDSEEDVEKEESLVDNDLPTSEIWEYRHARRRGTESSYRHQRHNQFYPIFIDEENKKVVRTGNSIPLDEEPNFF